MTLRTVLLSLQALLSAAEPDDPQDAVVAKQYKEQPDMFRKTARHWANTYAGGEQCALLLSSVGCLCGSEDVTGFDVTLRRGRVL